MRDLGMIRTALCALSFTGVLDKARRFILRGSSKCQILGVYDV